MSKFIVKDRGTGKTRELLEYAKENNAIVVCSSAARMRIKAEAYGITGLEFISYSEVCLMLKECLTLGGQTFVVDEAAAFLSYITASKCIGFDQSTDYGEFE